MPKIIVNKELCIKCNTCTAICLMGIISPATEAAYPNVPEEKANYCMKCGHCEAYCPTQALILDFLPEAKVTYAPGDTNVEPQRLSLFMKNRRSCRSFNKQTVNHDTILEILDACHYAPTGGNSQTVSWIVIHNPEEVQKIAKLTVDWMRTIIDTPHPMAPYVKRIITAWDKGDDPICRHAPHLVFTLLPKSEFFDDRTDGVIALTHFDLLVPTYGLGACWAGFIRMAIDSYKPLQEAITLPDNKKVAYALFFGYPAMLPSAIPRRNPININWI